MKRLIALLAILILMAACPSMAANKIWPATCLTGSTNCLDAIDGNGLADGDGAIVVYRDGSTDKGYIYRLDATSGATESVPNVISPDTNAGTKRWLLVSLSILNTYSDVVALWASGSCTGYLKSDGTCDTGGGGGGTGDVTAAGNNTFTGTNLFKNTVSFQKSDSTPIMAIPTAPPVSGTSRIMITDDSGSTTWFNTTSDCFMMGNTTTGNPICNTGIDMWKILDNTLIYGTPTSGHYWCAYWDSTNSIWKLTSCGLPITDNSTNGNVLKKSGGAIENASSGTDYAPATSGTSMLKGNGSGGFSNASAGTDYTSPSSTESFTNKTFDASGTGNVLKQKRYLIFTNPSRCDETGALVDTTKANMTYGQCLFSASAAYTANWAEYRLAVPEDIDTAVDMKARFKFSLSGADTGAHCYKIGLYTAANSSSATYSENHLVNMPFTADGSGASGDIEDTGLVTLTDWAGHVTAGQLLVIRVGRDGGNEGSACASGAGSTVTSYSGPLVIEYSSSL